MWTPMAASLASAAVELRSTGRTDGSAASWAEASSGFVQTPVRPCTRFVGMPESAQVRIRTSSSFADEFDYAHRFAGGVKARLRLARADDGVRPYTDRPTCIHRIGGRRSGSRQSGRGRGR